MLRQLYLLAWPHALKACADHADALDREKSIGEITYAIARAGLESPVATTFDRSALRQPPGKRVVKAAITAAAMAASQVLAAEPALKIDQHVADLRIVSSDANSNQLKLGFKKAVVIDLSADVRDVLVADPETVKVILRTTRRVYIVGAALGKTNVFSLIMMADRSSR